MTDGDVVTNTNNAYIFSVTHNTIVSYYPRVGVSKRGYSSRPVCVCVCECVCVCPAFLFWLLLLSLRILERLQTFSPVAKSCLLSIDVFFLLL